MKAILSGDWHYSLYSEGKTIGELSEQLHYLDQTNRNICKYAVDNNITHIVVLGDIYHTKSLIYSIAQSVLLDMVRDYKQLTFVFLQGNHDLSSKSKTSVSTLKGLKSESNIVVIDETTTLPEFPNCIFVPYTSNLINDVVTNGAETLFSHFGLNEATLASGISIVSDIKLSDLKPRYKNVFLGHYHNPQDLIYPDIKLYYTGSSIQLDLGEKNQVKRFLVYDTDTFAVDSVETEGYKKVFEYVVTEQNRTEVLEKSKQNKEDGHSVSLVFKSKDVDTTGIDEDFIIINKVEKDVTDRGMSNLMSEEDKLTRYMEINNISEAERDVYLKVAIEIINEVGV